MSRHRHEPDTNGRRTLDVKKALVVGINSYGFPNDLSSCGRDAEMFGNVLETVYRFDQVRVLKDGEATRDGVDRGLEWLCQSASANDRLVFFFSGHGGRYDKNGVVEEALVLQDGRFLDGHHITERAQHVPAGVLTVVVDAAFAGVEELLIHPTGQVEIARSKRWIPVDADRGRQERLLTPGTKAFTPFGHVKPVSPAEMAAQLRRGSTLDAPPARLTSTTEPATKTLFVVPCLLDETTTAATSQTGGLSPFTYCLIDAIRRLGHNRSAIELLQAAGYELRQLGFAQTPLLREPAQPEHLGLRAFLTFQPVLFVYPPSTPGSEGEDDLRRSIAEAVRSTLINIKEGRSMQATIPGGQTFMGEGTFSPFGFGTPGWSGQQGMQGMWGGGYGQQHGLHEQVGQVVAAIVPAILASLQNRPHQPYLPGFQPSFQGGGFGGLQGGFGGFQGGFGGLQGGQGFTGGMGGGSLPPYEIAQIVSAVTPIVASLIQSRSYQGHLGQFMQRAA
jgi:hypothetical protein